MDLIFPKKTIRSPVDRWGASPETVNRILPFTGNGLLLPSRNSVRRIHFCRCNCLASDVTIKPVIFHGCVSIKWMTWLEGNVGKTHGCMDRYPRAIKRNSVTAHTKTTITIHVPCRGNQVQTTIPEIIDNRSGITGRE